MKAFPQQAELSQICPEPTNGSISRGSRPLLSTNLAWATRASASWVKWVRLCLLPVYGVSQANCSESGTSRLVNAPT